MDTDTVDRASTRFERIKKQHRDLFKLCQWRDDVMSCRNRTRPPATKDVVFIEISHSPYNLVKSVQFVAANEVSENRLFRTLKTIVKRRYCIDYPEYPVNILEPHDGSSCFLYLKNRDGNIIAVMRVVLDSPTGLCMEPSFLPEIHLLRQMNMSIAEPSRFVNMGGRGVFKQLMRAIYQLACWLKLDYYLLQNRQEHSKFYAKKFGAIKVRSDQAALGCENMLWHIPSTPEQFLKTFGADQSGLLRSLKQLGYVA